MTKEGFASRVKEVFANTAINITSEGRTYLGAPIGTSAYCEAFILAKVASWSSELQQLMQITQSDPHAAYAAFTHGLSSHWLYTSKTTPSISYLLQPLEDINANQLLLALTSNAPFDDYTRALLALPPK